MNREQRRDWRRHVLGCTELTATQRLVLLALETFADYPAGTNARPGVANLADMCRFGERVVKSALERGRRLKLIEQTARANPKLGLAAVYSLLPAPTSKCTSVHLETDFKVHDRTFQGARNDVSRCTTVPPTNPYQSSNTKERGSPQPGTSPDEPRQLTDLSPQKLSNSNTSERCPAHAHIDYDDDVPPCRACKALRLAAEKLTAATAADVEQSRAAESRARRDAINSCPHCDDNGLINIDDDSTIVKRCTHEEATP
ncbi:helix-turn-helix domain-containing protein [Mycolicibacter hiberniae]|uniref:Helix-turn-helix domain-containing protein n=1 Tax=Mycolicibacter hiberniae TaxID=29314 RepID=A0A7I7X096_9MYCO|nr:helix-turn-helix domain-containing protein [Mycolicibacter hiberniae]MCV7085805.1 helix-turn-helix domain-containing protein [Mycolicibacter hiberniae]BBZ22822.1 hypothetical protein MHIB_12400 [Mycolicibacter hiberniae]